MRVYCPAKNIKSGRLIISDRSKIHYLLDVLRLKNGDTLEVFDGFREYECLVDRINKANISAKIIRVNRNKKRNFGLEIALACALPKKSKIDYIIEKCTELGVEKVIPMFTERTISKPKSEGTDTRHRRWQRIAEEASRQSGRISFPVIEPAVDFRKAVLKSRSYDLALIPSLGARYKDVKDVLRGFGGRSVIVFIGPEGDFSQAEIGLARNAGCISVSLGELVLKVDTAAIAVVSILRLGR